MSKVSGVKGVHSEQRTGGSSGAALDAADPFGGILVTGGGGGASAVGGALAPLVTADLVRMDYGADECPGENVGGHHRLLQLHSV